MSQKQSPTVQVLIASTLKPVRDVRAFEKLAQSLGETSKYRLNIIGFSEEKPADEGKYRFFSSMSHFDSTIDRLFAQVRFLTKLFQIRPKLLICCTYEYLPIASLLKPFIGYQLVYDVQENYVGNLQLNPNLASWKRKIAQWTIQRAEDVKGIDLYLLAESCYQEEMPEKRPFLLLENKYQGEIKTATQYKLNSSDSLKFCITGTITPAYGTKEGLTWFQKLVETFPHFQLTIIGHCPLVNYRKELEALARNSPQIILQLLPHPIEYKAIEQVLFESDIALLPYQNRPEFEAKLPTKLFECAALGIPVLMTTNRKWEDFFNSYQGGYSVDFTESSNATEIFQQVISQTYFSTPVNEAILWKSQKPAFQQAIQHLLS